ncbi:MAG: hypothetical protein QOE05_1287, partial [Actinomycetota bacterium]|nr:hypothetical protein [Actinomycetota bacterium]
ACADFGAGTQEGGVDTVAVTCDLATSHVAAAAEFSPPRAVLTKAGQPGTVPAGVVVRSAKVGTDVKRATDGTSTTTIEAEANGVDVLGVVRIGRVTASLTAAVHGRPGSAKLDYKRTVTGVTVNGADVCGSACSVDQVADAVNRALGGRAVVEFPDGDAYASKKGVVARLTDDRYRHVERVLLDDQPDDNVLLPAMQVTVFTDGTMASRQIVSLAAMSTQAIYRNYRVGSPQDPFPKPPLPTGGTTVTVPGTPGRPGTDVITDGPVPPAPTPTVAPLAQGGGPGGLLGAIGRGVRVAFRSPGTVAGIALMWSLLAVPVYLAARRRLLLDLPRLRRDLEEA